MKLPKIFKKLTYVSLG